jgi:hypothetical protein
MLPVKRWPVVMKDELELLASDELHTAEAGEVLSHLFIKMQEEAHSCPFFFGAYVAQQWILLCLQG